MDYLFVPVEVEEEEKDLNHRDHAGGDVTPGSSSNSSSSSSIFLSTRMVPGAYLRSVSSSGIPPRDPSVNVEHLTCFASGMFLLAEKSGRTATAVPPPTKRSSNFTDKEVATRLLQTCCDMYAFTETSLAPEAVMMKRHQQQVFEKERAGRSKNLEKLSPFIGANPDGRQFLI